MDTLTRTQNTARNDLAITAAYPSFSERRHAAGIARRFTIDAVRGRREEARRFLSSGIDMLEKGLACGADLGFLQDTAKGLHDAVTRVMACMRKDLDNAGCDERGADIDMAELDTILKYIANGFAPAGKEVGA